MGTSLIHDCDTGGVAGQTPAMIRAVR